MCPGSPLLLDGNTSCKAAGIRDLIHVWVFYHQCASNEKAGNDVASSVLLVPLGKIKSQKEQWVGRDSQSPKGNS